MNQFTKVQLESPLPRETITIFFIRLDFAVNLYKIKPSGIDYVFAPFLGVFKVRGNLVGKVINFVIVLLMFCYLLLTINMVVLK